MLKYMDNDVARTRSWILLLKMSSCTKYWSWAYNIVGDAADHENKAFFRGLWKEVNIDSNNVFFEWRKLGGDLAFMKNKDGTYIVGTISELNPHMFEPQSQSTNDAAPNPMPKAWPPLVQTTRLQTIRPFLRSTKETKTAPTGRSPRHQTLPALAGLMPDL